MNRVKNNYTLYITVIFVISSFFYYCTGENPLDVTGNMSDNFDHASGIMTDMNKSFNNLAKSHSSENYLSSKADLQFNFLKPEQNWNINDLSEGSAIVSLYSPNILTNSPAEDLLPRVTIVEKIFGEDEGKAAGWSTKGMANYRSTQLKEKYGEENVNIIGMEENTFKNFPCTHFTYEVKYPVSRKHSITNEYGFYHNNNYYMVQFSRPVNDINDYEISQAFYRFSNSLNIIKH